MPLKMSLGKPLRMPLRKPLKMTEWHQQRLMPLRLKRR